MYASSTSEAAFANRWYPSSVGHPMCGVSTTFGELRQRVSGRQRLLVEDVETGAGDPFPGQRRDER